MFLLETLHILAMFYHLFGTNQFLMLKIDQSINHGNLNICYSVRCQRDEAAFPVCSEGFAAPLGYQRQHSEGRWSGGSSSQRATKGVYQLIAGCYIFVEKFIKNLKTYKVTWTNFCIKWNANLIRYIATTSCPFQFAFSHLPKPLFKVWATFLPT